MLSLSSAIKLTWVMQPLNLSYSLSPPETIFSSESCNWVPHFELGHEKGARGNVRLGFQAERSSECSLASCVKFARISVVFSQEKGRRNPDANGIRAGEAHYTLELKTAEIWHSPELPSFLQRLSSWNDLGPVIRIASNLSGMLSRTRRIHFLQENSLSPNSILK